MNLLTSKEIQKRAGIDHKTLERYHRQGLIKPIATYPTNGKREGFWWLPEVVEVIQNKKREWWANELPNRGHKK